MVPPPEVKLSVVPAQIGELDETVGLGTAFTVTLTVLVLLQPAAVAVTV